MLHPGQSARCVASLGSILHLDLDTGPKLQDLKKVGPRELKVHLRMKVWKGQWENKANDRCGQET